MSLSLESLESLYLLKVELALSLNTDSTFEHTATDIITVELLNKGHYTGPMILSLVERSFLSRRSNNTLKY